MAHYWLRHESRANEARAALTPAGAARLLAEGHAVTVEESATRIFPTADYAAAGATIAPTESWRTAPAEALILGLKELPDSDAPLPHRHIMFGHAFKGQHSGQALLDRFRAGGGLLLDLEYLTDATGRRLAAFGYWAGYAGAAVSLLTWAAQQRGRGQAPVSAWPSGPAMLAEVQSALVPLGGTRPTALVIGALGRVGQGASDLCDAMGVPVTKWDMAETAHGGPFPEVLAHDLFFNCILARPGTPLFVPKSALGAPRRLTVIGDIACDPDSDYNPVPLYEKATSWEAPALRVHEAPPLDIMAIDNLPSLLPRESAEDFADQLLPLLRDPGHAAWARAEETFRRHL